MEKPPARLDKVLLDLSHAEEAPRPPAASKVVVAEPMTRFACNLQGCCCGGWNVSLRPTDLVRLGRRLDPKDRAKLSTEVTFKAKVDPVTGDRSIEEVVLNDPQGTCRFISDDGRLCTLHASYGLEAMPDVCVDFPVVAYGSEGATATFTFDPVCPSVLDQLAESDGPLKLVELSPPYDESTTHRSRRPRDYGPPRVGARELTPDELEHVRATVLASLGVTARPWWQHLHGLELAFAKLAATGDVASFEIVPPEDPRPFLMHLGRCLAVHDPADLLDMLREYRRFVFDVLLDLSEAGLAKLFAQLESGWNGARSRELASVNPLLVRWVAHAFVKPWMPPDNDVCWYAATVTYRFATALRYASALAGALERPIDTKVMKVALGAGEFFCRGAVIPPDEMPRFTL